MSGAWRPIATAPKSTVTGSGVQGVYLLGFCPDESMSPEACIDVVWWEPLTASEDGTLGGWYGNGAMEVRPTHWMPLPEAPPAANPARAEA